jgi:hypothetical protein
MDQVDDPSTCEIVDQTDELTVEPGLVPRGLRIACYRHVFHAAMVSDSDQGQGIWVELMNENHSRFSPPRLRSFRSALAAPDWSLPPLPTVRRRG